MASGKWSPDTWYKKRNIASFIFASISVSASEDSLIVKLYAPCKKSIIWKSESYHLRNNIPRNDQWNNKAKQLNNHLKEMCSSVNMDYIEHFKNSNPKRHLSNSKLHLNEKGSWKLNNIFASYLFDIFKWNNDISPTVNISVNDHDKTVSYENEEKVSSSISSNTNSEFFGDKLKALHLSNVDHIIVAQIYVNSIRNRFDALMTGIQNNVDIVSHLKQNLMKLFPLGNIQLKALPHHAVWIGILWGWSNCLC